MKNTINNIENTMKKLQQKNYEKYVKEHTKYYRNTISNIENLMKVKKNHAFRQACLCLNVICYNF